MPACPHRLILPNLPKLAGATPSSSLPLHAKRIASASTRGPIQVALPPCHILGAASASTGVPQVASISRDQSLNSRAPERVLLVAAMQNLHLAWIKLT